MLTLERSKSHIVERTLRTKTGELARVSFLVVEHNGQIRARIVSVEPIRSLEGQVGSKTTYNLLACIFDTERAESTLASTFFEFVSPYFDLDFLTSQPTRAPSLAF